MLCNEQGFITSDELKKTFGFNRDGDLGNFLRKNNIPFLQGKKGIVTTWAVLNIALVSQGGYSICVSEEPKGVM